MAFDNTKPLWREGTIIASRYRLRERIGQGATAEVWRARHVSSGISVAIKLVDWAAEANGEKLVARFYREACAAAAIASPHVVRILEEGTHGRVAFIAMELLRGETLAERLQRKGSLPPEEVAQIVTSVADAIGRAHAAGIVHRDLKPSNVFLTTDEYGHRLVKVLDFGIAKRGRASVPDGGPREEDLTRQNAIVGTPAYMSPEQVRGEDLDGRSDLWQLAVVAFECLCGRRPFEAKSIGDLYLRICCGPATVPSHVAAVPVGFDAWFARATRQDREARFASAEDFARQFVRAMRTPMSEANVGRSPEHAFERMLDKVTQPDLLPRSARLALVFSPLALIVFALLLELKVSGARVAAPREEQAGVSVAIALPGDTAASAASPPPCTNAAQLKGSPGSGCPGRR